MAKLGQNIDIKKENGNLIITINTKAKSTPSKSGKSLIVASSLGNKPIEGTDLILGLNLYKPAD